MSVRQAIVGVAFGTLLVASGGCGGDNSDDLERARREGARQARLEERQREQRKEQARLRKELSALRNGGSTSSQRSSSSGASPGAAALSQGSSCGDGITAGANTTCAFARNVRDIYTNSGGESVIEVYSPVTKQTYTMTCSGSGVTTCTGGNGATVSFR